MSSLERNPAGDLLVVLAEADVLETFQRLPAAARDNFTRWIDKARDDESHWQRIEALVLALRIGPLQPEPKSRAEARKPT